MSKIGLLTVGITRTFYDAWVVLLLWGWFIAPLGAVKITYWHAYGLDVMIGVASFPACAMIYARTDGDMEEGHAKKSIFFGLGTYTTALAFGFLAHKMMGG